MKKSLLLLSLISIWGTNWALADTGFQLSIGANTNIPLQTVDFPDNNMREYFFMNTSLYVEAGFAFQFRSTLQPGISLIIRQNPIKVISSSSHFGLKLSLTLGLDKFEWGCYLENDVIFYGALNNSSDSSTSQFVYGEVSAGFNMSFSNFGLDLALVIPYGNDDYLNRLFEYSTEPSSFRVGISYKFISKNVKNRKKRNHDEHDQIIFKNQDKNPDEPSSRVPVANVPEAQEPTDAQVPEDFDPPDREEP